MGVSHTLTEYTRSSLRLVSKAERQALVSWASCVKGPTAAKALDAGGLPLCLGGALSRNVPVPSTMTSYSFAISSMVAVCERTGAGWEEKGRMENGRRLVYVLGGTKREEDGGYGEAV